MTTTPLSAGELVARTRPVLDLAPRRARLIALMGAVGAVLVVIGSLRGNRPATIGVELGAVGADDPHRGGDITLSKL